MEIFFYIAIVIAPTLIRFRCGHVECVVKAACMANVRWTRSVFVLILGILCAFCWLCWRRLFSPTSKREQRLCVHNTYCRAAPPPTAWHESRRAIPFRSDENMVNVASINVRWWRSKQSICCCCLFGGCSWRTTMGRHTPHIFYTSMCARNVPSRNIRQRVWIEHVAREKFTQYGSQRGIWLVLFRTRWLVWRIWRNLFFVDRGMLRASRLGWCAQIIHFRGAKYGCVCLWIARFFCGPYIWWVCISNIYGKICNAFSRWKL